MEQHRPRWRFRIGTLMLLVAIVGLAIALIVERLNHVRDLQKLEAELAESKRISVLTKRALGAAYEALARLKAAASSHASLGGVPDRAKDAGR